MGSSTAVEQPESRDRDRSNVEVECDRLNTAISDAHDQLTALVERIGSVIRVNDDGVKSGETLAEVASQRSSHAALIATFASEVEHLTDRMRELRDDIDL